MKRIIAAVLSLGLAVSLAGCGSNATDDTNDTKDVSTTVSSATKKSESSSSSEKSEEFGKGSSQTDTGEQRIVATSVAIAEILDALKVPVVGVPTSSYDLPDSMKDATEVGNPMSPDMEVIKSLDPTMVFSVVTLESTLKKQFDAVNIPSEFVDLNSFAGLLESIDLIGEQTGTSEAAEKLSDDMQTRTDTVSDSVKDKESPSVLIIFGVSGEFQVATEKSYVGDLVKRAGGTNVIQDAESGFMPVDMEYLAKQNPDYILLMTHANPEESKKAFEKEFSENAAWNNFSAVKNDHVITLETSYFGMSANLLAPDAIEKLEEIFYETQE